MKTKLKSVFKKIWVFLKAVFTPHYVDMGMIETTDEQLRELAEAIVNFEL